MKKQETFYQCLTDFIFLEDDPEKADIIFVPGGNYPDAAQHAAELYHAGYAPYVMPSGRYSIVKGYFELPEAEQKRIVEQYVHGAKGEEKCADSAGDIPKYETECDYLCDILIRAGVPESAILREDQATYTYENAIYSRKLADRLGIPVKKAILSCQAFHARRCFLYYQEQFPETEFLVCPIVTKEIGRETWLDSELGIDTVLGEVERCGAQFHEIMRGYLKNKE